MEWTVFYALLSRPPRSSRSVGTSRSRNGVSYGPDTQGIHGYSHQRHPHRHCRHLPLQRAGSSPTSPTPSCWYLSRHSPLATVRCDIRSHAPLSHSLSSRQTYRLRLYQLPRTVYRQHRLTSSSGRFSLCSRPITHARTIIHLPRQCPISHLQTPLVPKPGDVASAFPRCRATCRNCGYCFVFGLGRLCSLSSSAHA